MLSSYLEPLKEKLEKIISIREKEYATQKDKLKDIAQEAKHVRETQIVPIFKKIESFINGISK